MSHDSEEFVSLWTASQPGVAAFVSSLIPDFHAAQDVLQETARILVTKFDQYDRSRPFIAWAIGVARGEVLAYRRRQATSKLVLDDAALEQLASVYPHIAGDLGPLAAALEICLGQVKGKPRRLLELRYEMDFKPAQMAQHLQLSVNSVTVALHRIRQALRECIESRIAAGAGVK